MTFSQSHFDGRNSQLPSGVFTDFGWPGLNRRKVDIADGIRCLVSGHFIIWMKVMPESPYRITPAGILDGSRGNAVLQQVSEALERGDTSIDVDMDAVTFMDSAGFGTLVTAFKKVKAAGGRFRLMNVNSQVRLVLEITGTDRMLMLLEDNESTP